jgi:hypothetical protein
MNFPTSTHRARWIFRSPEALQERYEAAHAAAVARLSMAAAQGEPASADADADNTNSSSAPISAADERVLRLYYEGRLRALADAAGLPPRVAITALCYFKRFYAGAAAEAAQASGGEDAAAPPPPPAPPSSSSASSSSSLSGASCLEHDPARIAPACLYLACKVEEAPLLADELAARLQGGEAARAALEALRTGGKVPASDMGTALLRTEVPLLQGLGFELIVHSPRRALLGLLQDLAGSGSDGARGGGGGGGGGAAGGRARGGAAALAPAAEGAAPATRQAALAHGLDPELASAPLAALCLGDPQQQQQSQQQQQQAADALRGVLSQRALRALDAALASDAPLLHAPGALAAAALRSALRRQGLPWRGWAARLAAMSVAEAAAAPGGGGGGEEAAGGGGGGGGEAKAAAERLASEMDGVDALVVAWQKEQAGGPGEQQQQQQEGAAAGAGAAGAEAAAAPAQAPEAAPRRPLAERAADADRRLKVWRAAQRQRQQPLSGKRGRSEGGGAAEGEEEDEEAEGAAAG